MITGSHVVLYTKNAAKDRAFFRDVLKFPYVDTGHDWLIFALPPSEMGVHPDAENNRHELYLMCDDLKRTLAALKRRKVKFTRVVDVGWGILTSIKLPGGGKLGLYQPKHEIAHAAKKKSRR